MRTPSLAARSALVVVLFVASSGIVACSPGTETPASSAAPSITETTSPSATASASATPSPSPSASATPAAAVGDPCADPSIDASGLAAIDFGRYSEICLGMSFAEATVAMPGPDIVGEAACPWFATVFAVDDPGLYVAAVTHPEAEGEEIFLFRMIWIGDLAGAAAFPAPETTAGISVGSTAAEVLTAYPTAVAVVIDDMARGPRNQLIVAGPAGTSLVFDVTEGAVDTIFWGNNISSGASGELCAL